MADSQSVSSTGRLEAFSDGVFAIAITLLILDLRVPRLDHVADAVRASPGLLPSAALGQQLLALWPNAFAYVMSFAVILVIWVNHHRIFTIVRRTDQTFLLGNGLLLMFVSLVPFPTALLAEYLWHGDPGQFRLAALVYAGNGLLISLTFRIIWRYAIRDGRLLPAGYDPAQIKQINNEYRWSPLASVVVFLIAFVAPYVSMGLSFAVVITYSVQGLTHWRPKRLKPGT